MKAFVSVALAFLLMSSLLFACAPPAASPPAAPTPTATSVPAPTTPRASPTLTSAATPQYGGVLKLGFVSNVTSLHPASGGGGGVMQAPYDTLLRMDEKGEIAPWLATDWKFGADYKSLTLTLRKGVRFHDGTELDAAAVKWNIEARKAARLGDYEEVASVDVVDDYTVRLNLSKFRNTSLVSLRSTGGMMSSSTAYAKDGAELARMRPVGTGPFKFAGYELSVRVKYERFDGYWQK